MEKLPPGTHIDNLRVDRILGSGGFGVVYEATSSNGSEKYAIKLEETNANLRLEASLLRTLKQCGLLRHFCRINGTGRVIHHRHTFSYIVMTLAGKSIHRLRKMSPGQLFGINTAVGVGIQSLEALQDLHSIGYLHRDIKPENIATGRPEIGELQKIYMLDLGLARKYVKEDHPPFTIRHPRKKAGFRGTVRYASIACHMEREQSRKDDCESWLYMLIELTTGRLPWRNHDIHQTGEWKQSVRKNPTRRAKLFKGCPEEYKEIMSYIESLGYYDRPDYDRVFFLLRQVLASRRLFERPYDWEDPRWPKISRA